MIFAGVIALDFSSYVFAFILRWYFHCVINSSYSFSSNFLKLARECFIYIGNMHIEIWFHSDDFCQSYCPWLLELVFAFILRWYFHFVINSSYSFSSNFLKLAGNIWYTLVICIFKYGSTRMIFGHIYCPLLPELHFAFIMRSYLSSVINSSYCFSSNFLKHDGNIQYTLEMCILTNDSTWVIFVKVIAHDF